MIIYIDGVFDLFHYGHIEIFKKCKYLYENIYLIVGIVSDKIAMNYKRKPIYNEKHRYALVENSKYVNKIVKDCPLIITKQFMEKHKIDLVVHSFSNKNDKDKQDEFFKYPKSINKFREIEYCNEISTTEIMNNIKKNY